MLSQYLIPVVLCVSHSFSVNAINRWCVHSYMTYDGCQLYWNQFICHGQTRQKIKTQKKGAATGLTQCHYYGVQHEVEIHVCRLLQQFWPDWHQLHFAAVVWHSRRAFHWQPWTALSHHWNTEQQHECLPPPTYLSPTVMHSSLAKEIHRQA